MSADQRERLRNHLLTQCLSFGLDGGAAQGLCERSMRLFAISGLVDDEEGGAGLNLLPDIRGARERNE